MCVSTNLPLVDCLVSGHQLLAGSAAGARFILIQRRRKSRCFGKLSEKVAIPEGETRVSKTG